MEKIHRVAIVVDAAFGQKLLGLSNRLHVWICSTPANMEAINKIWSKVNKQSDLESGVTSFNVNEGATSQEMLLGIVNNVNLHHAEYSHTPPWTVLEVYGVKSSVQIKSKLEEYGRGSFVETEYGFNFVRELK